MKRIVVSALLLASSFAHAGETCFKLPFGGKRHCITIPDAPPAKQCAVLHEHAHFAGAAFGVLAETESADISGGMIERRRWRGTLRGWSGKDRSWNDAVSSVTVTPGCVLRTWSDGSFTGEPRIYDGISEAQVPSDNTVTSFKCSCNDTKIEGPDGSGPIYYTSTLP